MSKIKTLASGIGWGTISTVAVTGFQLVFMAIMARLLDPSNFGLVAMANVSLRFFSYFAQLGTAPALIQKPKLEDGDIAAALTVSVGISSLFFILILACAPLFESFFKMPGLTAIIQVLALNFVIGGFSAVSVGLLRRNAAFKALAIIDIVSYVVGYGLVGLGTAYAGLEVWALVAAFMTQTTLTSVLSYLAMRFPLSFKHTATQRRHFFSYGGRYSVIGFIEFLTSNLDALLVGKLFGATPAGHYNRAQLLANLPIQQPANILTKALFPVMSSIGDQHEKQSVSLQLSTLLVGSYAFAVGAGIYVAAADIVKVLLGDMWLESIPLLQMLAWSVGPLYISHVAGVSLDAMNKLSMKLRIQFSMLLLLCALLLWRAPGGSALDIAMAVAITEWVRLGVMAVSMALLLNVSLKNGVRITLAISVVALSSAGMIQLAINYMPPNTAAMLRLAIEMMAGGIGLLLGGLLTRHLAIRLPAMRFLVKRAPRIAKLFPRFS